MAITVMTITVSDCCESYIFLDEGELMCLRCGQRCKPVTTDIKEGEPCQPN